MKDKNQINDPYFLLIVNGMRDFWWDDLLYVTLYSTHGELLTMMSTNFSVVGSYIIYCTTSYILFGISTTKLLLLVISDDLVQ